MTVFSLQVKCMCNYKDFYVRTLFKMQMKTRTRNIHIQFSLSFNM